MLTGVSHGALWAHGPLHPQCSPGMFGLFAKGSEQNLNLLGAGPGLLLLDMLLVRMEREVGELLAIQKPRWCLGKAVPAPGSCQPWPHATWQEPTLTVGHADRAVDDFAGIVMDGDGDLVGGHQFPVEGGFDLHSSWEPQKDGSHRLCLCPPH